MMWWAHCVVSNRVDYRHRRDYVVGSLRRLQSCRLSSSLGLCGGLIASSPIVSIIVIAGIMWWAHCVVSNRVDYRHRRDYVVGSLCRLQSCRLSSEFLYSIGYLLDPHPPPPPPVCVADLLDDTTSHFAFIFACH